VLLASKVEENIYKCIELLSYREPEDLIFCRPKKRGKPINALTVQFGLIDALKNLGISEEERKQRVISFHSFRHLWNSFMRLNGISDPIVRKMTGHATESMTENYTKIIAEDFKDVQALQNRFLEWK
jgi:integrase